MRPSFVNQPKPFIATVITETTPDAVIATMRNAEYDGAQAFDIHFDSLEKQYHNRTDIEKILLSTNKPMLMIYYREGPDASIRTTDEEKAEVHKLAVRCGASACDIMGDMFDPSPFQITDNPAAIDKQRKLIDEIHQLGGEVVMSSHTWVQMSTEQVVEHLKQLEARGADMVKVAASANTEEDLLEAMRTTCVLKREMKVPFIHILMGQYGKLHRFVGPMLGSSLIFTVQQYSARGNKEQPLVRAAKAVFDNLDWRIARNALELQSTEGK